MPHVFPFLSHLSALWTFFVSTNTVFHKVAQKSTTHLFFAVRLYWQTTYPTNKYPKSWIFRPVRAALLVYNLNAQYVIFFATKDLSFFFFFFSQIASFMLSKLFPGPTAVFLNALTTCQTGPLLTSRYNTLFHLPSTFYQKIISFSNAKSNNNSAVTELELVIKPLGRVTVFHAQMPDNISKIGSDFWAVTLLTNCVVINSYSDGFPGSRVVLSSLA